MTAQPGTYALVLACHQTGSVRIGQLGTLELQQGFYVYVGSAHGPGGVAARIEHHRRIATRTHWHMDYLRPACDLIGIWFSTDTASHEHAWADAVARLPGATVPMPGFGASDCACDTHLFWFTQPPPVREFRQRVKTKVNVQ